MLQVASAGVVIASRCRSIIGSRQLLHEAPHMTQLHSSLPAWQAVDAHAREIGGAHLRDLDGRRPASAGRICMSSTTTGCSIISRQRITQKTLVAVVRSGAGGGPAGAHRGDVPRRSDQYHRAARGAAHRAALGFCGLARPSKPRSGFAPEARRLCRRGAARRQARRDGQEIQARGEYRHRRLGSRAFARVRCACAPNGAATSRRTSCRTSTARSSRI